MMMYIAPLGGALRGIQVSQDFATVSAYAVGTMLTRLQQEEISRLAAHTDGSAVANSLLQEPVDKHSLFR